MDGILNKTEMMPLRRDIATSDYQDLLIHPLLVKLYSMKVSTGSAIFGLSNGCSLDWQNKCVVSRRRIYRKTIDKEILWAMLYVNFFLALYSYSFLILLSHKSPALLIS